MPTRFYLPSSGTPPVTPALGSQWTITSGWTALPTRTVKANSSLANGTARTNGSTTSVTDRLDRVFVSDQLTAQTISGTFSAVIQAMENVDAHNAWLDIVIRVVSANGQTQRGVLYAGSTATVASATSTAENFELPISSTTPATRIKNAITLSSVTCQTGDRLVIEVGYRKQTTTSTYTATLRYGDPSGSTDASLSVGVTTATIAPWVELSQNLTFYTPPLDNGAARFTAVTDKLRMTTGLPTSTSYTILGWFRIYADPDDYQIFFVPINGSRLIFVETGVDGTSLDLNSSGTTSGTGDAANLRTLALNTWYRLALVVNGPSLTLYHGTETGDLTASVPTTPSPDQFIPTEIQFGADPNGAWMRGDMAAVKVYDRSLSAAEVVAELAQYKAASAVRGEYTMWDAVSTADTSGNGNTLAAGSTSPIAVDGPPIPLNPPAAGVVPGRFFHVLA